MKWIKRKLAAVVSLSHEVLDFAGLALIAAGVATGMGAQVLAGVILCTAVAALILNGLHLWVWN